MLTTKRIGKGVSLRISASSALRGPRILESIDHHDAVVSDHEARVAAGQSLVVHDGRPHAVADLLQTKVGNGASKGRAVNTSRSAKASLGIILPSYHGSCERLR